MCVKPYVSKHKWLPNYKGNKRFERIIAPCGKCIECMAARSREWTLLCSLELPLHTSNCFITLTYDEINNPVFLQKKDFQDFMKRLRKQTSTKLKYFAAAEYGKNTLRPHFHAIIFGYDFEDKIDIGASKKGHRMYTSPSLEKIWGKGLVTVQPVTTSTIAYCTLYGTKRLNKTAGRLEMSTGEYRYRYPEYVRTHPERNFMSQGLGVQPILDSMAQYIDYGTIWHDGQEYPIPKKALKKYYNIPTTPKGELSEAEYLSQSYQTYLLTIDKRKSIIKNNKNLQHAEYRANKKQFAHDNNLL